MEQKKPPEFQITLTQRELGQVIESEMDRRDEAQAVDQHNKFQGVVFAVIIAGLLFLVL